MRVKRLRLLVAAALAVQVLASGCLVFPELKNRVVELATTGVVTTDFAAQGSNSAYLEDKTIDIGSYVDIPKVLSDAGIDVSDVKSISLGGVAYRVSVADPDPTKEITTGTVRVEFAGNNQPLITDFSTKVGAVTGWTTATPDPAGVGVLNNLIQDILTKLQDGTPITSEMITYHIDGLIAPAPNTDFQYQIRLTLSIVGTVKVKIIE